VTIGSKRKRTSSTSPNERIEQRPNTGDDEIDQGSSNRGSDDSHVSGDDEDEWTGFADYDHEMREGSCDDEDVVCGGSDGSDDDSSGSP